MLHLLIPTIANIVLEDTIERIYVGDAYGDIPRGIYLIRGENVVLFGEVVYISTFNTGVN